MCRLLVDIAWSSLFADTSCMLSSGRYHVSLVVSGVTNQGESGSLGVLCFWRCLWISCPLSRGLDVPRSSGGVCGVSVRWSVPSCIWVSTDRARRSLLPSVGSQLVPVWDLSRVARRPLMSLCGRVDFLGPCG